MSMPAPPDGGPYETDRILVEACIEGRPAAWARLVERYEATVFFALRNTMRMHGREPDQTTLVDLQAEIFFRVVRDDFARLRTYSGRSSLKHWFKVITANFVVDTLRKRGPIASLDDPALAPLSRTLVDEAPPPDANMERRQAIALVRELWDELGDEDRRFVRLYYEEERPAEAVAEAMHTTVGAVYARKSRITRKLRAALRRRQCTAHPAVREVW